jgi:hypothetical protein
LTFTAPLSQYCLARPRLPGIGFLLPIRHHPMIIYSFFIRKARLNRLDSRLNQADSLFNRSISRLNRLDSSLNQPNLA